MVQATASVLRAHGLRVTPQRRAIWTVVSQAEGDHLTAEEVFRRTRALLPELSRATVYNALGEFVRCGLLALVEGPAPQRYDPNLEPHHHFRCRRCRRLYDVEPAGLESLRLRRPGFTVEQIHVLLEGICSACADAPGGGAVRVSRPAAAGSGRRRRRA